MSTKGLDVTLTHLQLRICPTCLTEFYGDGGKFCSQRCMEIYEKGLHYDKPRCVICNAVLSLPRHHKFRDISICPSCLITKARRTNIRRKFCEVCCNIIPSHISHFATCSIPCCIAHTFVKFILSPSKPLNIHKIRFNSSLVCVICRKSILHAKIRRKLTQVYKSKGELAAVEYLMGKIVQGKVRFHLRKAHQLCERQELARMITSLKQYLSSQKSVIPETVFNLTLRYAEATTPFWIDIIGYIQDKETPQEVASFLKAWYDSFAKMGLCPPLQLDRVRYDDLKRWWVERVTNEWISKLTKGGI